MIEILYDTENYVVCIKPYGVISQFDAHRSNMIDLLSKQLSCDIFPVHRLDRTSAGVMVFAKNEKTAAFLSRQISDGTFKKEYYVLVHGSLKDSGTMEDFLFFDRQKNKSYVVNKERNGVKYALLEYTPVTEQNGCTLVRIRLMTGRTHQIRVQFASRGIPLCGDKRYGAKDEKKNISIWSHKLYFEEPYTNKSLSFIKEPYQDFYY